MAEIYDIGDTPRITETFTDLTGALTDPGAVSCSVRTPDGTTTLYVYPTTAMTNPSLGVYTLDLPLTQSGQYGWKWNGTGASGQGVLIVRKSVA